MPVGSYINKSLKTKGQEAQLVNKPNTAIITSSNGEKEEVIFRTGTTGAKTSVNHPYFGPNSWIRVMPERGTRCIISQKAEDGEPFISNYYTEAQAESSIKATQEGNFFFRSLREGEINLTSPGIADAFLSRRGTLELRGGLTSLHLAHEDAEIKARAPTHSRSVLGNKLQEVGDEERFGVVVRPGALNFKFPGQPTIRNYVENAPLFYAKEYLRVLRSTGPVPGVVMVDHREGDVYDDNGLPVLSSGSGRPVRSITKYGTSVPGVSTDVEVDVDGNIQVSLPASALKGLAVDVLGPGNIEFTIGKDLIVSVLQAINMSALTGINLDSRTDIGLTALTQIDLDAPLVMLTDSPDTPAVRGRDLVQYLLYHTHYSAVGPTSPPIVPPPPTILSSKVTLS